MSKVVGLLVAAGGIGAVMYWQAPEIKHYMKVRQM
jgi:hypothetical protein